MKSFKKILSFVFVLTFSFLLVACSKDCKHVDINGDGICDNCSHEILSNVAQDVSLVSDGVANFQFVVADFVSSDVRVKLDQLIEHLSKLNIEVESVDDVKNNTQACEVLIGSVQSRGARYYYDSFKLGENGSAIKIIDQKIIIVGGSDEMLAKTFDRFVDNFMKINDKTTDIQTLTINANQCFENIQKAFTISNIKIASNNIKDYVISVPNYNPTIQECAKNFQSTIYSKTGIWLKIETNSSAEKAIVFRQVDQAGDDGFRVSINGSKMFLETPYMNRFIEATEAFINDKIGNRTGVINFGDGLIYTKAVKYVYYSSFGAKGDGVTNDFEAIMKAHEYANLYGQTAKANPGKTYYIGKTLGKTITIKTDVDWSGASFVIDDRSSCFTWENNTERNNSIFTVKSDYVGKTHRESSNSELFNKLKNGVSKNITNIGYSTGYKTMYILYNENKIMYIRDGVTGDDGDFQYELIVVDSTGKLEETSKLLFDYDEVTKIVEYRIDDKPITIKGGTFTTKANSAPSEYTYYARNLLIRRSNVVIDGLVHKIEGEGETGAPYMGFLNFNNVNNVLIQNCTLQAHKTFKDENGNMGSYDISARTSNNLYFKNCKQSNFFLSDGVSPSTYATVWGIMGSSYCKNITYDACELSRLDAHAGVYNASVINGSKITYISLIGGGTFRCEDSTIYIAYNNAAITLRPDYGSTWDGDIIIKNCKIVNNGDVNIIAATWVDDHYFGYKTTLPNKIVLDNIQLKTPGMVYIINDLTPQGDLDFTKDVVYVEEINKHNPNPMNMVDEIVVKNIHSSTMSEEIPQFYVSRDSWVNSQLQIKYED